MSAGFFDCWPWQAYVGPTGYGQFGGEGRRLVAAHRAVYEILVGSIPEGLTLDHLCRNRRCVNPAHLEPVTWLENVRRGESSSAKRGRQTHCQNGHEFTDENTYRHTAHRWRVCRTCAREYERIRGKTRTTTASRRSKAARAELVERLSS